MARRAPAFWRGALVVFFVVFTAGILSILRMPRVYESETVILARDAIRTDPYDNTPRIQAQRLGPKIKDLLFARSRLERIIVELGLYQNEIEKFGMLEAVQEMRTQIGFRTRDSDMFVISFQSTDRDLAQIVTARLAESMIDEFVRDNVGRTQAARDFLAEEEKRAEEDLDEKGRALSEFLARHPEFAWDPTRTLPGMPVQPLPIAPAPQTAAPPLRLSSDPELASLQRERARLEEQLAASRPRTVVNPEVKALEAERDRARTALAQAQAELAEKRQKLTEEHPDVIAARNRALAAGRAFGEAEAAYAKATSSSRPSPSPANEARLREQLASVKEAIAARERVLQSRGGSKGTAKKQPEKAPAEGWTTVELETEWQRLLRDVTEARRLKDDIAARRARAELAASATASSGSMLMTIIDPAFRPTRPIKPKRMVLGSMTLALSGALGVLWAFARVILDDVVFDAPDIESMHGPKVLVSVPRDPVPQEATGTALVVDGHRPVRSATQTPPPTRPPKAPPRLASASMAPSSGAALARAGEAHARAEEEEPQVVEVVEVEGPRSPDEMDLPIVGLRAIAALRVLRFRIEQRAQDGRMVVGITSSVSGEGKSRLAIQLALALAESERARVLLVEANLERPSLAKQLGVQLREQDAFSVQMRKRAFEEVASPWRIAACGGSLHLLAESSESPGFPGMLHSRELRIAIEELRPRYDYIVVDGPSILDDGGATSVERVVDGFVIVARAKVTKKSSLGRAARMLGQERMLGVVLTDVEEEA